VGFELVLDDLDVLETAVLVDVFPVTGLPAGLLPALLVVLIEVEPFP